MKILTFNVIKRKQKIIKKINNSNNNNSKNEK